VNLLFYKSANSRLFIMLDGKPPETGKQVAGFIFEKIFGLGESDKNTLQPVLKLLKR
jgi:hypothetical protein